MKRPSLFMGKIIVTLFPFTDIPSGMKPSAAKFSVLPRHPGLALFLRKVPKTPCFCGFYGVGSNEPIDEPSGFKRRGKIKLYQCRSYYAAGACPCTQSALLYVRRIFYCRSSILSKTQPLFRRGGHFPSSVFVNTQSHRCDNLCVTFTNSGACPCTRSALLYVRRFFYCRSWIIIYKPNFVISPWQTLI